MEAPSLWIIDYLMNYVTGRLLHPRNLYPLSIHGLCCSMILPNVTVSLLAAVGRLFENLQYQIHTWIWSSKFFKGSSANWKSPAAINSILADCTVSDLLQVCALPMRQQHHIPVGFL